MTININSDLGEGLNIEEYIMPYLNSCSLACGGHFGDYNSMSMAVEIAIRHDVQIGAHPSYPDKNFFGRKPFNISNHNLIKSIIDQIDSLRLILAKNNCELNHIKTHGALYNLSAKDYDLAMLIIELIKENYNGVFLYVPAKSLISELAIKNDLKIKNEVFLDRNYNIDNTLVSRDQSHALINSSKKMFERIKNVKTKGFLKASNGGEIVLEADTFCVHGDSPGIVKNLISLKSYITDEL